MGEVITRFESTRNSMRVFNAIQRVTINATREALQHAENDYARLRELRECYSLAAGEPIDALLLDLQYKIQELRADLLGDC